jgi:hypothetical protein
MTLVSASPAREHVLTLRAAGGTYEAIGRAAGIGVMTVHGIANSRRLRVQADVARRLLAVTQDDIRRLRPSANGAVWRLRALVAMGHSCTRMASAVGRPPAALRRIVRGEALTITPELRQAVTALFDAWWDKAPPCRTRREKLAASSARRRAALHNWPCPAGLDEDQLDKPGYRPRAGWLPATGTGVADPFIPAVRQKEDRMKPQRRTQPIQPVQRPGKRSQHARPSWTQMRLAGQLHRVGRAYAGAATAPGEQPSELNRPQLADLETAP